MSIVSDKNNADKGLDYELNGFLLFIFCLAAAEGLSGELGEVSSWTARQLPVGKKCTWRVTEIGTEIIGSNDQLKDPL